MCSFHAHYDQGHMKLLAQGFALRGKAIGCSLQSMVHMDSVGFVGPAQSAGDQECGGVSPAAKCNSPSGKMR
jgi:hypothetical protein